MLISGITLLLAANASAPAGTMAVATQRALTEGCIKHTLETRKVEQRNKAALDQAGVEITTSNIPEWIREGKPEWGSAVTASIASAEGPVWLAAFPNQSVCNVFLESGKRHDALASLIQQTLDRASGGWTKIDENRDRPDLVTRLYETSIKPRGTLRLVFTTTTDSAPKGGEMIILSTSRSN